MKEKIAKLRAKANTAREYAKKAYQWNTCTSNSHLLDAIVATADGLDLMADMLEQLYSEEETGE